MRPPVPHYLYRCFDAAGRLLYIGCTSHVANRMSSHRKDQRPKASRWLQATMDHFEVGGRYPTKADGLKAEAEAIYDEQPVFNTCGRGVAGFIVDARVVDYLFAHGHHDLAIVTTCNCGANDEPEWVCYAHESLALARTG